MTGRLEVEDLRVSIGGRLVVDAANLLLRAGELVALLGSNGVGKTSLIRGALGLLRADGGRALLVDAMGKRDIAAMPSTERARAIAYLPQTRPLAWPARVRDVVALGRFAHGGPLGRLSQADRAATERALAACDLAALAERRCDTLSGGELARVHIARALAAEAPLLIADEPVAALDPLHQHRVMALLRTAADRGGGVLVVLHDLALAARYADRLAWMKGGRILADGPVAQTMTAARIAQVYGVRARVDRGAGRLDVTVEGPA